MHSSLSFILFMFLWVPFTSLFCCSAFLCVFEPSWCLRPVVMCTAVGASFVSSLYETERLTYQTDCKGPLCLCMCVAIQYATHICVLLLVSIHKHMHTHAQCGQQASVSCCAGCCLLTVSITEPQAHFCPTASSTLSSLCV